MNGKIKDGWHLICGNEVYTENGYVVRGKKPSPTGLGEVSAYPYRASYFGNWDLDTSMSVRTFRRKIKEGTAILT